MRQKLETLVSRTNLRRLPAQLGCCPSFILAPTAPFSRASSSLPSNFDRPLEISAPLCLCWYPLAGIVFARKPVCTLLYTAGCKLAPARRTTKHVAIIFVPRPLPCPARSYSTLVRVHVSNVPVAARPA
ncbi:hypothetical protein J1614_007607 [Plenodomus biglobosus]|nr:hypothetical protein J1614_007607 [Plenodomus biglobosus]